MHFKYLFKLLKNPFKRHRTVCITENWIKTSFPLIWLPFFIIVALKCTVMPFNIKISDETRNTAQTTIYAVQNSNKLHILQTCEILYFSLKINVRFFLQFKFFTIFNSLHTNRYLFVRAGVSQFHLQKHLLTVNFYLK